MSVLFKALSRAAKAAGAQRAETPAPQPELARAPRLPRMGRGRIALVAATAGLGSLVAMLFVAGDDVLFLLEDMASQVTGNPPTPAIRVPRPPPVEPPVPAAREEAASPVPPEAGAPVITPPAEPEPAVGQAPSVEAMLQADLPTVMEAIRAGKRDMGRVAALVPALPEPAAPASQLPAGSPPPGAEPAPANGAGQPPPAGPAQAQGVQAVAVKSTPMELRDELELAYGALLAGRFHAAVEGYQAVLQRESRNLPALLGLAAAQHKLRLTAEASRTYAKVLEVDQDNREALTNLISLHAAEAPQEALRRLGELRQANPGFSPIPAQMAIIHAGHGDLGAAILHLGQALALAPDNVVYRYNLAVLQDRAAMRQEAADNYEQVLGAVASGRAPAPAPVEQLRERLRFLRTR